VSTPNSALITRSSALRTPGRGTSLIRDLLERLFRRKTQLLILLGLWTGGVVAYVVLAPPLYQEEVQFLINNNRAPEVVSPEMNSGPVARDYVDDSVIATELQLLSNVDLLRDVVKKCGLAKSGDPAAVEEAVRHLRKELKTAPVLKANMIKATYSASDPNQVEAVLRTLSDDYLNEHLRAHGPAGTYELFAKQANEYEQQLKTLQDQLTQFHAQRNIVELGEQKDLNLRKLIDLQAALKDAVANRAEDIQKIGTLKAEQAGLGPRITTQARKIPNQYSVERLNTMLVELQNKRTELAAKYQPTERVIREVDQEIADTRAALKDADRMASTEETTDVNPLRQSLEAELAKTQVAEKEEQIHIANLERDIEGYRHSLSGLEDATASDDQLVRRIKEAEDNFFLYSKKREEARIEEAMDRRKIANVALVQPATVPALPLPAVSLTLVATFALGCLLIVSMSIATGLASRKISTAWELEVLTGLPVLAEVPVEVVLPAAGGVMPVIDPELSV
jgi:uncharacterized protein involved in exopolysaccharide biosynthesis